MTKVICNLCGKEPECWDTTEHITHIFDYTSKYAGYVLELDICAQCFDKLVDEYILPNSVVVPLE